MRVRRLGWAGLEVTAAGESLVIDFVGGRMESMLPAGSLVRPDGPVSAALVTHLHFDHADPDAVQSVLAPGGVVLRPRPLDGSEAENYWTAAAEKGFATMSDVEVVADWENRAIGPFSVTAVPAVDGFGDPQVSWVVEADGQRIFHGGDTLFHGFWWLIAGRHGPFDAAFLPVNGAVVDMPQWRPASPLPADLTPEQAVVAGMILRARRVVPVHYGLDVAGHYVEVDAAVEEFVRVAGERGVEALVLGVGEEVHLSPDLAARVD
ncbi:MBL fold metallo-hydrolase [Actinocrispum sp. NPDC049592]|uniref:MBL fold metallo-hydrolase n=1 Tax=Actinocrispum sp. NPDC049592 TaxID=3154835 RepID=UPI00342589F6